MTANINAILSMILKALAVVLIGISLYDPTVLGHWEAQRDIAYDSIWSEYVVDCDCADAIE